jgi:hypothetical protein
MIGLSRQFREKNENDYIEININVTSPPTTYNCAFTPALTNYGGAKSYDFYHGTFEIDWGDGSDTQNIDDSPFLGHSYGVTGSYTIRVYGRDPINSFGGWQFSAPSGVDWGTLDFSNYNYMRKFYLPSTATASIIMPTQYLSTPLGNNTSLYFRSNSGSINIQGITDSTFDTTQWGGFNSLYTLGSTVNFDRIKLNDVNSDSGGQFFWRSDLVAVGPSAGDANNWDADFTNQNLNSQFHIKGTGITGATGNIQNIYFDGTSTMRTMSIYDTAVNEIDFSVLGWQNSVQLWIDCQNCPLLQTVTLPGATLGTWYIIRFNDCDLVGHLDMKDLTLWEGPQLYLDGWNNPNLTQVTAPTGSNAIIVSVKYYGCGLTALNGFEKFTQWGDVNNARYEVHDNSLGVVEVNKFLVNVNNGCTAGFTGRQINISSNIAPDGSSGGYDGVTAKNDLITKGWIVTTD